MANPNFLSANPSGLERMQAGDQAYGYDVNRIVSALTGINLIPITIGNLSVVGTLNVAGSTVIDPGPLTVRFTGGTNLILNRLDGAAALMTHVAIQRAGTSKWWLGLDVSDQFILLNAVGSIANLTVTDLGALIVRAGITVGGSLLISPASSKVIPGSTQLSLRNNADSADNLLITDAGDLTGRTKLTMPGPLVLTTAASKIVPGATSFSLRNNADNADNLILTDAGLGTMRNALSIPPAASGTVASTNYGSIPVLIDVQSPSGVASFTLGGTTLPTGFRNLFVKYQARETGATSTDLVGIQFNSDTGNNYYTDRVAISGVTAWSAPVESLTVANGKVGFLSGSSVADAAHAGIGFFEIPNYNGTDFYKQWHGRSAVNIGVATTNVQSALLWGLWKSTAAVTKITILAGTGNFVSGSVFELWGEP